MKAIKKKKGIFSVIIFYKILWLGKSWPRLRKMTDLHYVLLSMFICVKA